MTAWQVVGVMALMVISYIVGRHRREVRHETPFLHDSPVHHHYRKRTLRPAHELIWDLDGVPWDEADLPSWWHRCRPQTCTIYSNGLSHKDRCACGGERWGVFGKWTRRDERCVTSGSDTSSV